MKYLVISDIHGSSYYAKKIDEIYNKENPDKIILLGDLYYHPMRGIGPNDCEKYNPIEVATILNKYKDKILCTRGNCDAEICDKISNFKIEDYIELNINGVDFFFSHGHKYNIDNVPPTGKVVVYGHLHIGFIKEEYGVIFVNAGSISLPRRGSENSYLIIVDNEIVLKDVCGKIIDRKILKI